MNILNTLKTIGISTLLILTFSHISFSQGQFDFNEMTHDFGTVVEGNVASHEFEFTNTGDQPIIISNVRASCGCTTPFWTKEPVLPGQKGKIKASYNSKGRPGAFNKTITITSNSTEPSKRLTIKGNVERKVIEPKYSESELANSPQIQLTEGEYNLGKVELGQGVAKTIEITNVGKTPLIIKDLQSSCNCVSILSSPKSIAPGTKGELEIKITPRLLTKRKEMISLFTNDLKTPKTIITYDIEVVKDLSNTSLMQSPDNSNPFK